MKPIVKSIQMSVSSIHFLLRIIWEKKKIYSYYFSTFLHNGLLWRFKESMNGWNWKELPSFYSILMIIDVNILLRGSEYVLHLQLRCLTFEYLVYMTSLWEHIWENNLKDWRDTFGVYLRVLKHVYKTANKSLQNMISWFWISPILYDGHCIQQLCLNDWCVQFIQWSLFQ
jgi:hypothetical protein